MATNDVALSDGEPLSFAEMKNMYSSLTSLSSTLERDTTPDVAFILKGRVTSLLVIKML